MHQARADLIKLAETLRQSTPNRANEQDRGRHTREPSGESAVQALASGLSSIGDRLMTRRARVRIP
jgi:hypothetical protein